MDKLTEGMDVTILGGAGFVGYHLERLLTAHGCNVTVLDVNLGWSREMPHAKYIRGSITNDWTLSHAITKGTEVVIDLAGISHTVSSANGIAQTLEAGVYGLGRVLDFLKFRRLDPMVMMASSSLTSGVFDRSSQYDSPARKSEETEYNRRMLGPDTPVVKNAETRMDISGCYHPYVTNKIAMEMLLQDRKDVLRSVAMRFGTLFGPYMAPHVVTWNFMVNAAVGKPLVIEGDGSQLRQHWFVEDLVNGIYRVMLERLLYNEPGAMVRSIVPPWMVSVTELALRIQEISGANIVYEPARKTDVKAWMIVPMKQSTRVDRKSWEWPVTSLDDGLKKTFDWFKQRIDDQQRVIPISSFYPDYVIGRKG